MKHGKILLATGLLLGLNTVVGHAALYDRGNGLVYDDVLNTTWNKDTNLLKTLASASGNAANFVQQIIAASSGKIYDGNNGGDRALNSSDFSIAPNSASMTWWGVHGFVDYLNSSHYQGYSDWRLPSVSPVNGVSLNRSFSYSGSTDVGQNITSSASELAYMWHVNLQLPDRYFPNGSLNPAWSNSTGFFLNFADAASANAGDSFIFGGNQSLWSELHPNTNATPSMFWMLLGAQSINDSERSVGVGAWIVRTGDVATVPVPNAAWLFGSVILGFAGLKLRSSQS